MRKRAVPDEARPIAPELDLLRALAEGSPAATALLGGAAHRILHVNAAFAAAAGRAAAELHGLTLAEAFPDLAAAGHLAALDAVLDSGIGRSTLGQPLRLGPEAGPRFWDVETTALRGRDGTAWGLMVQLRDVTAQQRALREAEAARATLDALFEHIPEGLMLVEAPGPRVTRISAHGLRLAGGTAEVLGQEVTVLASAWQFRRAADGAPPRPEELPLARAMRDGRTVRYETWLLRRPDGTELPVRCLAGPIRDTTGRVTGGILVWRDITELHRAEAALAASEARYRALVEAGALAVWTTDAEGRLSRDADWLALTGQSPEEAAGRGWLEVVHPEDRAAERERWEAALAAGEPYEAEYRLRHPAGGWHWTAARAVPLRDAAGRIAEWVGVNTDIDGRKRAEQALRVGEARFRTLAEAMPHLVWQTDARGEAEYMNRRMQGYTDIDLAGARNGGWLAALHPEDAAPLARAWGEALATGADYTADTRIRGRDGAYRWFQVKGAAVRDAEGAIRHWVGTCTDIEDRHRAEAALREALAAQQALAREADHRIKNSLQLVAALLRLQAGRMEEPAARLALEAATVRVQAVAEAHRALQKSPDLRNIRLADMLRELAAGAAMQHPGADLRAQAPETLMLDAERAIPLALILSELVANILRHAAPGEGAGTVWLSARVEAEMLAVEVAHANAGALEPSQDEATAARLGETVVRALARQIGASLATEGGAGEASRITLTLRLEAAEAASAEAGGG